MWSTTNPVHSMVNHMYGAAIQICSVANQMHGLADPMSSAADSKCQTPPTYMEKNKLILNEYIGIFMHFESIFFFLIWKMEIFRPTHPLNLEYSIFLNLP